MSDKEDIKEPNLTEDLVRAEQETAELQKEATANLNEGTAKLLHD